MAGMDTLRHQSRSESFGLAREAIQQWAEYKEVERADHTDLVETRRGIMNGLITLAMVGRIAGGGQSVSNSFCRRR